MGDNDFPAVMANGNGNSFLSGYMKKRGFYGEQGTDIPGGSVSYQSEQSLGEPLMEQMQIAGMKVSDSDPVTILEIMTQEAEKLRK